MNKYLSVLKEIMGDKKRAALLILALLGILLIFIPASSGKGSGEDSDLAAYKLEVEEELSELCSSIDGVGKCRVKVSFEEGESYKYSGGKIVSTSPPRVLGVTVVCEGGDDTQVAARISDCMTSLFDIGSNRVCVLKLK